MKPLFLIPLLILLYSHSAPAQSIAFNDELRIAANSFLQSLTPVQRKKTQFAFEDEERYHWHYVPMERKGIALKEFTATQHQAAMQLLRTALSDTGFEKTKAIIELEAILRVVENRSPDDYYRDPGKYYFSIFGNPLTDSLWGWRLEGHHIAFNFTSGAEGLVSGTPGFLGANPAVVLSGRQKGKEVLKEETRRGFALLQALSGVQKQKAIISTRAPFDIITGASRRAMIEQQEGILYTELTHSQQQLLLQLLHVYLHRYKEPLARKMMQDIMEAGIGKLRFAWAGAQQPGLGNAHYYRIQGPTLIIEYDNTQNNANHIHTVVRDLQNDFGDQLLEHYRNGKH